MENFQQYLENNWPRERRSRIAASATEDQVRAVLRKDYLQPADFLWRHVDQDRVLATTAGLDSLGKLVQAHGGIILQL